jgi:PleD family two-component response regulator
MKKAKRLPRRHMTPVFLLVDQHREAVYRIQQTLQSEWLYIPLCDPNLAVPYAKRLSPTAIFLADPTSFTESETEKLLRALVEEVKKPVVILVELWTPELAKEWKKLGAADCLPHPTRIMGRMNHMNSKMQEFAMAEWRKEVPPGPWPWGPPRG